MAEASRGGSIVGTIPLCIQSDIVSLPGCSGLDLALLQNPVIGPFLVHWKGGTFLGPKDRDQIGVGTKELFRQWERLKEKDYVLYRCIYAPGGCKVVFQLVLPQCLQQKVLSSLHENHGHQVMECTLHLEQSHCYWLCMAKDIEVVF